MTTAPFDGIPSAPRPTLHRTRTGQRLHIPGCPHIGSALVEATPTEQLALEVCSWCQAQLDDVGRTYYDTLDDAMRALGCHAGTHALIREHLRFVAHDAIWLPHSRSYIALGLDGRGVAWVGKGYVFVKATERFSELPGYRAGGGGGAPRQDQYGETCPVHHLARSLAGVCDECE